MTMTMMPEACHDHLHTKETIQRKKEGEEDSKMSSQRQCIPDPPVWPLAPLVCRYGG